MEEGASDSKEQLRLNEDQLKKRGHQLQQLLKEVDEKAEALNDLAVDNDRKKAQLVDLKR
jgi:hypothetical protein